jgi:hypothetical protein
MALRESHVDEERAMEKSKREAHHKVVRLVLPARVA